MDTNICKKNQTKRIILLCYGAALAEPPTMESARISARSLSEAVCNSCSSGTSELPVSCSKHEQSDLAQS